MPTRLVIFDVDGTLLKVYSWQHAHQELGTWNRAKEHRRQFLENRITYRRWAGLDAALWKNQPSTRMQRVISRMPYTVGARQTLRTLKKRGIKVWLLSAGLAQAAEKIQNDTQAVDGYTANVLEAKDSVLTGRVKVNVAYNDKGRHVTRILKRFNLDPEECATVGDDSSLISLFRKVGLTIAFDPTDDNVAAHADVTVTSRDLRDSLPHILRQRQEIRTQTSTE